LFGAAIGSFLNVLIYRMPQGVSIIKPRSYCPNCKKPIRWYENFPIISFIFLKGRCSRCQQKISIHYPFVEFISGCFFLYLFAKYGFGIELFFYLFFFSALIVISGIDYSCQVIPDIISIPGIILGIIFQIIEGNFLPGLFGMLFGGILILLIRVIGGWAYKKEVMGMGDVYLAAMIGAFVGFPLIIPSIFVAAFVGAVLGIIYISATHQSRESTLPFGPFLSIGGIAVIIFNQKIIQLFESFGIYL
jgi:leader peptidase (prepilin peptidase)/N-methyltransferase